MFEQLEINAEIQKVGDIIILLSHPAKKYFIFSGKKTIHQKRMVRS